MTLIKCPHCGHSVLSVASLCPTCNAALGSTFLGPEHRGELVECRSCGHAVRSASRTCPNCGVKRPGKRRILSGAFMTMSALLLIGAFIAYRWPDNAGMETVAATPTPPPPPAETSSVTARPQAAPASETAQAVVLPDSSVPRATPLLAAPPTDTIVKESGGLPLQTKWTMLWVNVRQGPADKAPIVKVLRPGTKVEALPRRYGWWLIFESGDSIGYIAGALLSGRPPQQSASIR